jgi:hypothetical protein
MILGLPDPHPDPLDRGTDPTIRIRYQNVTTLDSQHWFVQKRQCKENYGASFTAPYRGTRYFYFTVTQLIFFKH